MITGELGFYTVGTSLLASINSVLQGSVGGPVQRSGMVPGRIAWDECDCGLLACSLTRTFLSNELPRPVEDNVVPCSAAWLAGELTIQLIRCAPTPNSGELFPSVEALDASAQVFISDKWQLMNTVPCALQTLEDSFQIAGYHVNQTVAQGPSGGCGGCELTVVVGIGRG